MNTDILNPDNAINQMIELHLKLTKLEHQIAPLNPISLIKKPITND